MVLALYPVVELTRVILVAGALYFPDMHISFAIEIALMWALYLAIIPAFLILEKRGRMD
jgi:hypothetical protein